MQAAPSEQARLLHLAEIDLAVEQARHRRANLPELATLRELGARRNAVTQQLVAAETRVSDLDDEVSRLNSDLEPAKARLERNQARVDSGAIADPKALRSMLEELEHLRGRISKLEDDELDLMQKAEDAGKHRDQVAAERASIDDTARGLIAAREKAFGEIDAEIEAELSRRQGVVAGLPEPLVALYEKIAARAGTGAGRLRDGRCTGCHVEANAADLRRYQQTPADEVVRCEECGRILIR